jgi:hypothetical protein
VLGNEISKNRPWQGTLRMVAIHNRVLTAEQIQQNFEVGVGQKFFLLFGIGNVEGVPTGSYIMFEVSQYDIYSYLFARPTFINLDASVVPGSIPIAGMRIAINGKEAAVGQAYTNLNMTIGNNYDPATGEVLSSLGTIIALQNGQSGDEFFLTFELLGSETNSFSEVSSTAPQKLPPPAAASDIGVRTFDEINATMADLTGVPVTTMMTTFTRIKQQLPPVESIEGFVSAHQVAITQLTFGYCDALVEDSTRSSNFFGPFGFNAFDFNVSVALPDQAEKYKVVDALFYNMVGHSTTTNDPAGDLLKTAPTRTELRQILVDGFMEPDPNNGGALTPVPALFDSIATDCTASCEAPQQTRNIVKAMCSAVLGSAVMLIQ